MLDFANHCSSAKVGVRSAWTIPSKGDHKWDYTGHVVVIFNC